MLADDIVISGISGRFPESDDIEEFWDNLINGRELHTSNERRWPVGLYDLPAITGTIKNLEIMDSEFFKYEINEANNMDPQIRMLHEVTYEAIYDSGVIPDELRGSKTAIALGVWHDNSSIAVLKNTTLNEKEKIFYRKGPALISSFFGFTGPAIELDTACAASFSCFNEAILMMTAGHCEHSVVGGVACNLSPSYSQLFLKIKMISIDGRPKCMDASANGYSRSEAVVALFVQKRRNAKRIYASVIDCRTLTDGYKPEGITFPRIETQRRLLKEVIQRSKINPLSVEYIETHITGTAAGDPVESQALLDAYRENDKKPILFGCLKSNMGHSESASAVCAIVKVAKIFQNHLIPPNINFKTPNPNIKGLIEKQIIPVLEKTTFHGTIIPLNSFGFGGVNVHAIFAANEKKSNEADAFDNATLIPRLVNVSGRTECGVNHAIDWIESNRNMVSKEFLSLLNDVSKTPLESGMHCRGYAIVNKQTIRRKIEINHEKRPLWFIYSGLGSQWQEMANGLMAFKPFSDSIWRSARILRSNDIELTNLLQSKILDSDITSAFVAIVSVQIALTDLLFFLGLKPQGIIGHSLGEIVAGYCDGCLTALEALLTALSIAKRSEEAQYTNGAMAAIGLNWEEATKHCPANVYPSCDNSENGITISGDVEALRSFVSRLNAEKVFAKEVKSCGMAFHCPLLSLSFDKILSEVSKIIKCPKKRSNRWISTSERRNNFESLCDAKYYANNVVSPVCFKNAAKNIPENACIVEIGPHPILIPILRKTMPKASFVSLMNRNSSDQVIDMLSSVGNIYINGHNPFIERLYPKVDYPVSRGTASLSHLLKWDHSRSHFVAKYPDYFGVQSQRETVEIDLNNEKMQFLEGHCIDGKLLFPASGYLFHVWSKYAVSKGRIGVQEMNIEFRNIKLHRATLMSKNATLKLQIIFDKCSDRFFVLESDSGSICVSGFINELSFNEELLNAFEDENRHSLTLDSKEIYKELKIRGYDYGSSFRGLMKAFSDGTKGTIKWTGEWISFVDSMFHLSILAVNGRHLTLPTVIESFKCDSFTFFKATNESDIFDVQFDKLSNICFTNGMEVKGLKMTPVSKRQEQKLNLSRQLFIPFSETIKTPIEVVKSIADLSATLMKSMNSSNRQSQLQVAFPFTFNYKKLLNPQLHVACEQTMNEMKIVEFNNTHFKLIDDINSAVNAMTLKYSLTSFPSKSNCYKLENGISETDLIVYKCSSTELLTREEDIRTREQLLEQFKSFHSSLKNGGFLIYFFRVKLTHFEKQIIFGTNNCVNGVRSETEVIQTAEIVGFKEVFKSNDDIGMCSMLFRKVEKVVNPVVIKTTHENYKWVTELQNEMKIKSERKIWLLGSLNTSGVFGLINCLRKEPGGHRIRCLVSNGNDVPQAIIERDLYKNISKGALNGTTVTEKFEDHLIDTEHAYLDLLTKGDLSSFRWFESENKYWTSLSLQKRQQSGQFMSRICYAALNFKDVMVAIGRIPTNAYPKGWSGLGIEYSGNDENGNRIFGIASEKALSTTLMINTNDFYFIVPRNWTLEEAATVPVVYATAYYSLLIRGNLKPKERVLIHAGSGGVGQAAISICLSMECEVFTSVGTEEKKRFLMNTFPKLRDRHFVNSRDLTFEEYILKATDSKGVDLILNSLAEEKLRASIGCLADHGRFVEIGKYDLVQDNQFDPTLFQRNKTFHVICVATFIHETLTLRTKSATKMYQKLQKLFENGLKNGEIKPLQRTIFNINECEEAFRFMASGKHIGKILIKIRDEEFIQPMKLKVEAIPQTHCHPTKVYVIVGGLGGLGLEVALWLATRGAKNLILTSRIGIRNNFQRIMIKKIEAEGCNVLVVKNDAFTLDSTAKLLLNAEKLGSVGGIFNLAMVLNDALFNNQTEETFRKVCSAKANTTIYLDEVSRHLCLQLDYFVCFSSIVSGVGNAGQTNYGFANSVMESICEKRRQDHLHGLAVQWGAVGDVGIVSEMNAIDNIVIAGSLPQKLPSLLRTLDTFMNSTHAVCSCFVPNEQTITDNSEVLKADLLKTICRILGVSFSSRLQDSTTIGELGMDSLMAVEIEQTLHRDYNKVMNATDIRQLTVKGVKNISELKSD